MEHVPRYSSLDRLEIRIFEKNKIRHEPSPKFIWPFITLTFCCLQWFPCLGLDPAQYKAATNHHGNEDSGSFLMNEEERFKVWSYFVSNTSFRTDKRPKIKPHLNCFNFSFSFTCYRMLTSFMSNAQTPNALIPWLNSRESWMTR